MIVFLPIKPAATGGTSSFAKKFKAGMAIKGHKVIFNYQAAYDILLVSASAPWRYLRDAKRRAKPIIHRLDGVYYPTTTAGWLYPILNAHLSFIQKFFADATIYQSKYSQKTVERFLGKSRSPSTIIYNGVDTTRFSPQGTHVSLHDNPDQQLFITASRFRRADQIIPVIDAFEAYQRRYQANSKLVVIGNFEGSVASVPAQYARHSSISFLSVVPNVKLSQYLREGHVFLFTHLNPPCPNNVLEAMACGLPICGMADGAMPELVRNGEQGELIPVSGTAFYRPRRYDKNELARRMAQCAAQRDLYGLSCRKRVETEFNLDRMLDRYLEVLENTLHRRMREKAQR